MAIGKVHFQVGKKDYHHRIWEILKKECQDHRESVSKQDTDLGSFVQRLGSTFLSRQTTQGS